MRHVISIAAVAYLFAQPIFVLSAHAASGYRTAELEVAHRDRPLRLHIWYPGKDDGDPRALGQNAVFKGIEVRVGASPRPGKFPLVLLSHGSGGNAINIGWIANHLADQGMIVVATNHLGTTSRDSIPKETVKIWQRPADLSAVIDRFEKAPPGKLVPDMDRIGTVGFSLGGHTALALTGALVSKQRYVEYCAQIPGMFDCRWFRTAGVDLNATNEAKFNQTNRDERVKNAVAVDPGLAQAYDPESLTKIKLPIQIINLGRAREVPAAINGKNVAEALSNSIYQTVERSSHYSFLGECTQMGEAIIKNEGEEPICTEYYGRRRSDVHIELKDLITKFLKRHL